MKILLLSGWYSSSIIYSWVGFYDRVPWQKGKNCEFFIIGQFWAQTGSTSSNLSCQFYFLSKGCHTLKVMGKNLSYLKNWYFRNRLVMNHWDKTTVKLSCSQHKNQAAYALYLLCRWSWKVLIKLEEIEKMMKNFHFTHHI